MNSCVLMAKIINNPEQRYTQENLPFTTMMVEHTNQYTTQQGNSEQKFNLKVTAWGNLSTDVFQKYHQGDTVILVGRLSMNVFETREGYKEKRAELSVTQIYSAGGEDYQAPSYAPSGETSEREGAFNGSQKKTTTEAAQPANASYAQEREAGASSSKTLTKTPPTNNTINEDEHDDIPF